MTRHIHIHLHTRDAGVFEESKHKRQAGKFAKTEGPGAAPEEHISPRAESAINKAKMYALKHPGEGGATIPDDHLPMDVLSRIPDISSLAESGRPESHKRAAEEVAKGSSRAVEITRLDNGKLALTDGRHLRAASVNARRAGMPVELLIGSRRLKGKKAVAQSAANKLIQSDNQVRRALDFLKGYKSMVQAAHV